MSYQSRTKYTSRRDKYRKHARVYRLLGFLALLLIVLFLLFGVQDIYNWGRTFFMR